ncbi:MAG: YCF48-related protein [Proteobacteria bacterium]|nr:YCF48-related protein [Pseudomonadota bacterium]
MGHNINKMILLVFVLAMSSLAWGQKTAEVWPLADQSLMLSITKTSTGLIMVGERGHVLTSNDKGQSWQQLDNIPVRVLLTDVMSIGDKIWAVGHDATIIFSPDAGKSWQIQFYDPDKEIPLLSVFFIDENKGFALGAYGTVFMTENGGTTWQDNLISEELDYHLNGIVQLADGKLFIAAEAGYYFSSVDGGETWQDGELPYSGSMFGVISLGSDLVLYGLRGHILLSSDGGENWTELDNPLKNNLFSAVKINDQEAVLVGANGTRIRLKNGVVSDLEDEDTGRDFADVVLVDGSLVLVGEEGTMIQSYNK